MDNYGNNFDDMGFGRTEAVPVTVIKGLVGAVVGALPGVALWILVGKLGFIVAAIGLILAVGTIAGYSFMTKNNKLPTIYGIIICLAVMLIALYMSQRILYTWELADVFKEYIPQMKDLIVEQVKIYDSSLTDAEILEVVNDAYIDELLLEEFGFTEGTFSECWYNFGELLEKLDIKGDFTGSMVKSCLFAGAGGVAAFSKIN